MVKGCNPYIYQPYEYQPALPGPTFRNSQVPTVSSPIVNMTGQVYGITAAVAYVRGGPLAPQLRGVVYFQDVPGGVWVSAEVRGLPPYRPAEGNKDPVGPQGFHIHERGNCEIGDPNEPFKAAGEHWNPDNQPHGNHAGDFPVLFSNNGYARMCFFTNRFKAADVIGKAVMIHQNPDDYRTQPAGDAGKRLACGVIQAVSVSQQ